MIPEYQESGAKNRALFFWEIRENAEKSNKTGKPVFEKVPYVKIISPGNRNEIPVFRATEKYQKEYPREWEAFMNGEDYTEEGWPLAEWAQISRLQVAMLASEGIHTIEQLADTPDANCTRIGHGMLALKHKAQVHLQSISGEADLQKVSAENKKLQSRIEELEKQLSKLGEELDVANKALSKGK